MQCTDECETVVGQRKQGDQLAGWLAVAQKRSNGDECTQRDALGSEKYVGDGISRVWVIKWMQGRRGKGRG